MLDTDTVSFLLRGKGNVAMELMKRAPSTVCMSSITLAELRYGAEHRQSKKLHDLITAVASSIEVMVFGPEAASEFGRIGATLRRSGTPIGELDTMIAGHALSLDLILVTNNIRHFERVPGLRLENWA